MPKSRQRLSRIAGYDYRRLESCVAQHVRSISKGIRADLSKPGLVVVVKRGWALAAIKQHLPFGEFDRWLRAEFGWSKRTAEIFMSVTKWLGREAQLIAHVSISPTAAYRLAVPSVPAEARQEALERAESGERITVSAADDIIAKHYQRLDIPIKPPSDVRQLSAIERILKKARQRWSSKEFRVRVAELVDHVDAFASADRNGKGELR